MSTNQNQRITLTEKEVCLKLGISRITAYRLRKAGEISYLKIGRRIAYLESHITQYLQSAERMALPHEQQ